MTPKERIIRAIEFNSPDRLPLWPRCERTSWLKYGRALADLLNKYPLDINPVPKNINQIRKEIEQEPLTWTDEWNCVWERERPGFFGTVLKHPIENREDIDSYTFPDYSTPKYDAHFETKLERYANRNPDTFQIASMNYGVLWYRMWWLRGMSNAMEDTALADGFIEELRDRILNSQLSYLNRLIEIDADAIELGDDWGTQDALMISPESWRRIFKPAYKKLFDTIHNAGKYVVFETDGCTKDILEDWAETGVDLLSVQLNVTGLENASRIKGKTCFFADPDRQNILPKGSPEDVRKHINDIINALNTPAGGLMGCLYVTEEIPLANIDAALSTFLEYRP
jgi:uroporphyrinogen decarboxylase